MINGGEGRVKHFLVCGFESGRRDSRKTETILHSYVLVEPFKKRVAVKYCMHSKICKKIKKITNLFILVFH